MANGNPFYVQPGADYGRNLSGLAGTMMQASEMRRERDAEQRAIEKYASMKQGAIEAYRSGDPNKMAEFSLQNPEMAQALNAAMGFADKDTEKNYMDSLFDFYQNPTETNAGDLIKSRQDLLKKKGVPPERTKETDSFLERFQKDPEGTKKQAEVELAWRYPERFKAMREAVGDGDVEKAKKTANIKDWEYYRGLQSKDPVQAEMFAIQAGIKKEEQKISKTVARQNFETYQAMPEGPEKRAFAQMLGIDVGMSTKEQKEQAEYTDKIAGEIENADTTIALIDKLLGNKAYINSLTGLRGATPISVPGGVGYDATVTFEQMRDSLTLDNLSKMSGVLSDSDIKILSSAGSGIRAGMSGEAFKKKLNDIKNVLTRKTARYRDKLTAYPTVSTQEQYDNLPPGSVYIEDGVKYRKP